ncbi:flagellar hook-basal body protein [Paenibacillus sp. FSL K6-2524]|uniref:flagellar hook-basal body protein n=1 Tax=Paenibacillus sp. FSL K6-2524 TaxID=2954516 RepID=UPI0030F6F9B2
MLRGLYTAASGMITEQRRHDTVTQNIANMNTPGYKQVDSVKHSFPEMMVSLVGDSSSPTSRKIGKLTTGVFAEESLSSYTQGDLRETGNNSDFSLVSSLGLIDPATGEAMVFDATGKHVSENGDVTYRPQAFFSVMDNKDNVRYTRDGSFTVNAAGELRTSQGYRVLDEQGNAIVLNGSINTLTTDSKGNLIDDGQPLNVAMGIKVINRPQELVREGNGVFRAEDERVADIRALDVADAAEVRQGYLESSTVDPSQAMVELLAAQRAYESNQKIIQYYDKTLDKAVNEVGRV